jgi:nucleotide-binding universal stress UspA family protein
MQIIAHATDFSQLSAEAFAHALRMTIATNSHLYVLHVREPGSPEAWASFPHVRELLAQWGLMGLDEPPTHIEPKLGVRITKVEITHREPTSGLFDFILSHRPDLVVLATHGREGLSRWLSGSVSEEIARRTHLPTLFFGPQSRGFVAAGTGKMRLDRILVPVAHHPSPRRALHVLGSLLEPLGVDPTAFDFIHVGDTPPQIETASGTNGHDVEVLTGSVVEAILRLARDRRADLIAMPTVGHEGFLDALRGNTTEQVLRHAPCPVLAVRAPA